MTSATTGEYPDLDLYTVAEFGELISDLTLDQQATARADRARALSEIALEDFSRPKGPYGWTRGG